MNSPDAGTVYTARLPNIEVWTNTNVLPKDQLLSPDGGGGTMAFEAGRFLALGAGTLWSSANGINWSEHPVSASKAGLWDAAYGAGVYLAVGDNSTIIQSAPVEFTVVDPRQTEIGFEFTARIPPEQTGVIEVTESLNQPNWTFFSAVAGGDPGKSQVVTDTSVRGQRRFYRLRRQ